MGTIRRLTAANENLGFDAIVLGDVDGDGRPELLLTGANDAQVVRGTALAPVAAIGAAKQHEAGSLDDAPGSGVNAKSEEVRGRRGR